MYAQPLKRTRRLTGLAILAVASAGGTSASALACMPASVFQRDQAAQRVVQQHALPSIQTKVAVRVVCSSVYPLSCHASTQK